MNRGWSSLVRVWERMPLREPWRLLVPLLVVQWLAVCVFTFRVHHNGWLFYQGGDQIWYWTTSWLVGHGLIPETLISPAWSLLLTPFALIAGPGFISGLPAAVLIQGLVLGPIAIYCVYDIAARVAGRMVGYIASSLWVLGPYIAIPLFVHRYHDTYVDQFLPHPLGLTAMGDFPGTVALLAAGASMVRTYRTRSIEWAIATGLLTGLAVLTKASNLIFLAAPVLLFLLARYWRGLGAFAVALLPAVGALTLWKYRGYGYLPAFGNAYAPQHLALGTGTASILTPYHRYLELNWSHLQTNLDGLAEVFFSLRVLQFLPFAGAIAVARRSWPLALSLSAWFWLYFVIKGSDAVSSVDSGSFFRLLLPAIPPLLVMTATLPVLVPRFGTALAARFPAPPPRVPSRRILIVAAILFGLVPLVAAAALQPVKDGRLTIVQNSIGVPVDSGLHLTAQVHGRTVVLRWNAVREGSSRVFYRVGRFRGATPDVVCPPSSGAAVCHYVGDRILRTRATVAVDRPGPGIWKYRVLVGANWLDDPLKGDVFLVSDAAVARVP